MLQEKCELVTVILVVRNSANSICDCLNSIVSQRYRPLEIVLVDGCSDDDTVLVSRTFLNLHDIPFRVLGNPGRTLASGWNLGIRDAKGVFVVRPDGHATLSPDYICNGISKIRRDEATAAVGGVLENFGSGFFGVLASFVFKNPLAVGDSKFRIGVDQDQVTDTAVYAVYRRVIFEEVGMFNESLKRNQDINFHRRVQEKGYHFVTSPDMKACYIVRSTLPKFFKQAFSNGYWVTHGNSGYFRHRVPLIFLVFLLALLALQMWNVFYCVLIFYAIALVVSYSRMEKMSYSLVPFLVLLTFIFHICYGAGSFFGVINFNDKK